MHLMTFLNRLEEIIFRESVLIGKPKYGSLLYVFSWEYFHDVSIKQYGLSPFLV